MKKLFLFLTISILYSASFISCAKKTDTPTTTTVTNSLSASLGGTAWTATSVTASIYQGSFINILGTTSDGNTLQVTVPLDIKTGSYSIGPGTTNTVALNYGGTAYAETSGNGGTLTISSKDGSVIKGSFSKLTMHDTYFAKYEYNCSGSFVGKYQ